LNEIVEQLKSLELAVKIEETKAKIIIHESLPVIEGDPAQIRQLIQNLISNGLKYQKKGVLPEITIRTKEEDNGMMRIEVQDNGIGIKKEQYDNVFVMFRRLHSRQEYEGTGIGLAVCKRIVERHGGEIGVNSIYGEGSTFWFTMPISKISAENEELTTGVSSPANCIDLGV
jgi:light-regulated signal transduction histidine kinase (bacteriophytochrome)